MTDLEARASAAGVEMGYRDVNGKFVRSPDSSLLRAIEALEEAESTQSSGPGPLFVRPGGKLPFAGRILIDTETGGQITAEGVLPAETPLGYHNFRRAHDGSTHRLIVSPGSCYLPPDLLTWGWGAQVYAARSGRSWGIGDLEDLAELAKWSVSAGAGLVMINPLGAATPGQVIQPSPYYPSSRSFRNPLYLSVDRIARSSFDLDDTVVDDGALAGFRQRGRALNAKRLIDRDAAWDIKEPALELLYRKFNGHSNFDQFCAKHGRSLEDFAVFCVLAETHRGPRRDWPGGLSHPGDSRVSAFRNDNSDRIRFHKWLQWHLDTQLAGAGRHLRLVQDLPVGVDPEGADAWIWGDAFADGFELGAPPDDFNREGQCWGIAGFHPKRLRSTDYQPFIEMIRAGLAHSGGIRIDHVMGLFRLFWIPAGRPASEGVYVRYPAQHLLDIVALESHRARAFVVGEDLGTVEPGVREEMASRSILSYRLLAFEPTLAGIPQEAMAAVTTHDLPTLAGIWTGADSTAQEAAGLTPADEGLRAMRQRIADSTGLDPRLEVGEAIAAIYGKLARSRARVVLATLEDALVSTDRPNLPGVSEGWPNWRIALSQPLENLPELPEVARVTGSLQQARPLSD